MPDWGKVFKEIGASLAAAAREANARQRTRQRSARSFEVVYEPNRCLFWNCNRQIRDDHFLCYDHFLALKDGLIDECPSCGLAKDVQYEVCLACYQDAQSRPAKVQPRPSAPTYRWYKPEYSPTWERGDESADSFFAYILKLDDGTFYAGQTRELRERLSEHRDGRTQSTAGRNPKLVWFTTVESREDATELEVDLQKLVDSNPREIRRMVLEFRDLVQELDYS